MIKRAGLISVLLTASLFAQNTTSVKGNCNATASGSNITVTVKCDSSLSKQAAELLAKQYTEILKKIQQEHIAYDVVIVKLDSIQKGVDDLRSANSPRRLTASEIAKLKGLSAKLPTNSLMLIYSEEDQEALQYASEFREGLQLKPPYVQIVEFIEPPPVGIELNIPQAYARLRQEPEACRLVRSFLDANAIPYRIRTRDWAPFGSEINTCALIVGKKPI